MTVSSFPMNGLTTTMRLLAASMLTLIATTSAEVDIALRVGLIRVLPYCEKGENGEYSGFTIDFLDRLKEFAKQDGVNVTWVLGDEPPNYGDALSLIANDCTERCDEYDIIAGDFFVNPTRFTRVDFSPSWLRSTISSLKNLETKGASFDTMEQLEVVGGTACVLNGSYIETVVRGKYPFANYLECDGTQKCIEHLKLDDCSLYFDDELPLRYAILEEPNLEINRNYFNTQYLVWPMSYRIPADVSQMVKKWMYMAVTNATVDELFNNYFAYNTCPKGFAGKDCTEPCDEFHGEHNERTGECICVSTKWTGSDCSVEVMEDRNEVPWGLKMAIYILFGILEIAIAGFSYFVFHHRESPHVKGHSPLFLFFVLVGCAISSLSMVLIALENDGIMKVGNLNIMCNLSVWFYTIGFILTFGTLLAKAYRVHVIFMNSVKLVRKRITNREILKIPACLLIVDLIILAFGSSFDALYWTRDTSSEDKFGEPLSSVGRCTITNGGWLIALIVFHCVVLVTASYICYVSRNIPNNFSVGKYLSMAIVSNLQIYVIGLPILFFSGQDPVSYTFVLCAIIWINNVTVIGFIFGNLAYSVAFHTRFVSVASAMRMFTGEQEEAQKISTRVGSRNDTLFAYNSQSSQAPSQDPNESQTTVPFSTVPEDSVNDDQT